MALWTIIQTVICLYIMTHGDQRNSTSTQLPWYLWCSSLPSTTAHVLYPVSCEHSLCLRWTTVRYSIKEHVPVANYMTRENILLGIIWFHLYPANHIYLSCRKNGLKKGWLWTGTDSTNGHQCGNLSIYWYWYICSLQLHWHPVAVVQYTFTHKQYIAQHN